jgi:hypothetical protein
MPRLACSSTSNADRWLLMLSGNVHAVSLPIHPQLPRHSHTYSVSVSASTSHPIGAVRSLSWTSDGYGLAVGYDRGWAVWSVGGRLCGYGVKGEEEEEGDAFMRGVKELVGDDKSPGTGRG